jgi:CubicO group peptidase (beta-lactamase class C family)
MLPDPDSSQAQNDNWHLTLSSGHPTTCEETTMTTANFSEQERARLHDAMTSHVKSGQVPGLVALVYRDGQTHVVTAGVQTLGDPAPVRRDSIFRISSMTKPVTAAATMILVEDGKLKLDEPVDPLLPELANRRVLQRIDSPLDETVPAHRSITVRDLLAFTMGFGIVLAMPGTHPIQRAADDLELGQGPPNPAAVPAPDEWIRRLGTLPLIHHSGESWMYNTGADVLGVLIARAAGQSFESFLADRIFTPLGMRDTGFSVPAERLDRLVTGYETNPETGELDVSDPAAGGQWSRPPAFAGGGAGLVSTADDYLAFARMLLNGGELDGNRVLSAASVTAMTTNQIAALQQIQPRVGEGLLHHQGWGFGMSVDLPTADNSTVPGRYGWDGGLGTSWKLDPASGLIGILLTQAMWNSPEPPAICRDFWTTITGL